MIPKASASKKLHQTAQQKQDRTDEAAKEILAAQKIAKDAKTSRLRKARLKEAELDEALEETFPASDPVALGHSEHAGRPRVKRKPRSS